MNQKEPYYIFVDVEADRGGVLTEFGAVSEAREVFHGRIYEGAPDPKTPAVPIRGKQIATEQQVATDFDVWLLEVCKGRRPVFVSDNPAFDFKYIDDLFRHCNMRNPFGHSGRRIADFWAGLNNDWSLTQGWKKLRVTPHDHNPVNDSMGNLEAFEKLMQLAKEKREKESQPDTIMQQLTIIETQQELDALPVGSVVMTLWDEAPLHHVMQKFSDGWYGFPSTDPLYPFGGGHPKHNHVALLWRGW